ncbi:hypothetical protein BBO99_00002003 [Phytophthora kernoviae]|uniref:Uncharacterized protein n=2 Tax=Phytophthora kernoviae TaxID=325452 RepID=A0A3R7G0E5_9STRA|nr:hypothetical protein G195_000866 [Phytophthora kernoviae 00238/432]KAG2532846.1 hypothetical protein JM16_000008 [Phytophthora kernoviae]KAG2533550.1 hypothetical protein JM18_000008 [Phytophthora kernoviae]RLN11087.1 hypothetical protein BBI17_000210 [Phytophthora kernoviae]RLN86154.1 hypothetical protein BBO99_00002003 [Phytophthora kernoviae]
MSSHLVSGPPSSGGSAPPAASPPPPTVQPTLKVMRLYKPKLYSQGASGGSMLPTTLSEATATRHEFALSSMLILPDSFGEIFLGNTFSSYISVINPYSCELRDVGLSANIQCANDRVELHDNRYARTGKMPPPNPAAVLPAGFSLDMVVDYPLNQVGNHVLRVGVSYVDPVTSESKSLRKFYRFAVQNPLVITFKQNAVATQLQQGEALVEAQIRNVSKLPLFVDSIKFLPLAPFMAEEMLVDSVVKKQEGEAGSVQSQPVMRKVPGGSGGGGGAHGLVSNSDVTVVVGEVPKDVVVGQPFLASVCVSNKSTRNLALQLQFRKDLMRGIVCSSASHQNLGMLDAKTTKTVWVEFLPVVGGLQALSGAVCVDIRSGQEFTETAAVLAHILIAPSLSSCKALE